MALVIALLIVIAALRFAQGKLREAIPTEYNQKEMRLLRSSEPVLMSVSEEGTPSQ